MFKFNAGVSKGILFLLISIFVLIITPSQVSVLEGEAINSRSFPYLLVYIMLISSALLIIQGLTSKSKTYFEFSVEKAKEWIPPLTVFAIILIYTIVLPMIGFIISSIIAASLLLLLVKCKKVTYYIISYVCVFVIFWIFTEFLLVPLPSLLF